MRRALLSLLVALTISAGCAKESATAPSPSTSPASTTPTRIISLSGSLSFGSVDVGAKATATFTIANQGNALMTITSLTVPSGMGSVLAASWTSGTIPPGLSQTVTVQFQPVAAIDYAGNITVVGDQTAGTNTIAFAGSGSTNSKVSLTGRVASNFGGSLSGATVKFLDGPNSGLSTITDGGGNYTFSGVAVGNANLQANYQNYESSIKGVYVNGANTLNFSLNAPLFTAAGTGDNVFTIPSTVSRIRITARYTGFSSNFIVRIAGSLVVNELIGTGWGAVDFSGTYLTAGGTVQITNSSGVSWTFTEVR